MVADEKKGKKKRTAEMTAEELTAHRAADAKRKSEERAKKRAEENPEKYAAEQAAAGWARHKVAEPLTWAKLKQAYAENQRDRQNMKRIVENLEADREPMDGFKINDANIPYPDEKYATQYQVQHLLDVAACVLTTLDERGWEHIDPTDSQATGAGVDEYRQFGMRGLSIFSHEWSKFVTLVAQYFQKIGFDPKSDPTAEHLLAYGTVRLRRV